MKKIRKNEIELMLTVLAASKEGQVYAEKRAKEGAYYMEPKELDITSKK